MKQQCLNTSTESPKNHGDGPRHQTRLERNRQVRRLLVEFNALNGSGPEGELTPKEGHEGKSLCWSLYKQENDSVTRMYKCLCGRP